MKRCIHLDGFNKIIQASFTEGEDDLINNKISRNFGFSQTNNRSQFRYFAVYLSFSDFESNLMKNT